MNKYVKINECKENMERTTLKIKKIRKKVKRKNIIRICATLAAVTIGNKLLFGSWPIYKDNIKHYLVTETLMDSKGNIEYVNNTYDDYYWSLDKGLATPNSNINIRVERYDLDAKYMENDKYEYITYDFSNDSNINVEEIKSMITENSDYETFKSLNASSYRKEGKMCDWNKLKLEEQDIPFFKEDTIQYKIMERHPKEYIIKPEGSSFNKNVSAWWLVWVIIGLGGNCMLALMDSQYTTEKINDLQREIKCNETMIKHFEEEDLKRKLKKQENWEEQ